MNATNEPNLIVMVKAHGFAWNEETAQSNTFQLKNDAIDTTIALNEFDEAVRLFEGYGIDIMLFEDQDRSRPDAIFPNNWIAQVPGHGIWVFPMMAENRRREVRTDIIEAVQHATGEMQVRHLTSNRHDDFLEGTGSIIFNHIAKTAYACISPRTDVQLFEKFCGLIGYQPISFVATDARGKEIYHTNVMLSISDSVAVLCAEAVADPLERAMLKAKLQADGLAVLEISLQQMNHYGANVLAVRNKVGERFMVMSSVAWECLNAQQQGIIQAHFTEVITPSINTIETIGGGGIRCMMAGFFV